MVPRLPALLATVTLAAAIAAAMPFQRGTVPIGLPAAIDTGRPALTLLYQNFPNPFPAAGSGVTCIWFDLNRTTSVSLTIHDVRGNLVRTLDGCTFTPQTSDITGLDPLLGKLQGNGGPTWTQNLLPGSPAIDRGNTKVCRG